MGLAPISSVSLTKLNQEKSFEYNFLDPTTTDGWWVRWWWPPWPSSSLMSHFLFLRPLYIMRIMFPPHRRQDNFGRQSPETQRPWVRLFVGRMMIIINNTILIFWTLSNLSRCFLHYSGFNSRQHDHCNSEQLAQQINATMITIWRSKVPDNHNLD